MRIGVDACCWSNRRGFGRFTRELLLALVANDASNDYVLFVDKDAAASNELPGEVETVVVPTRRSPMSAASAVGRRSLEDVWSFTRQVLRHDVDLFFFPAVYSYFPIMNRTKIVVTLHDVIAERHPDMVFTSKKLQLFWNLKRRLAIRQAHLILTVSETSKRELISFLGVPEARVRVISEAANSGFTALAANGDRLNVLRTYGLTPDARLMLYVGGISPHKNLNSLVSAYRELLSDSTFADVRLALVGDYRDDPFFSAYPSLRSDIEEAGLEDKVIFTGYVPDHDLVSLYNATTLVVLPSFEEGFGLPALEAMACGAPVVCSDRGSLPEVVADAGLFFDPGNASEMAAVLKHVLSDAALQGRMREAGIKRALSFTWKRAAEDAVSIFEELYSRK
jgi:glycosyltransferase involved in cell wall biosynthesis